MWYVSSLKDGVSALGLQRELGFGRQKPIWTWLHKLPRAVVRAGRKCLGGEIEADETYVGAPGKGNRRQGAMSKVIHSAQMEKSGRDIGRIRLRCVTDVSADCPLTSVQGIVKVSATIHTGHTGGWRRYPGLTAAGYRHEVAAISNGRAR